MRQTITLIFCMVSNLTIFAQEKMYIHKSDHLTLGALISETDSVFFTNNGASISFKVGDNIALYPVSSLDSISFGDNSNTIVVTYNGTKASVINPLAFEGVSVTINGADVTVTSTSETKNINYSLTGTTTNGIFKMYSETAFNLLLNGVHITNTDGPAINIQSSKKGTVTITEGTSNSLTDGTTYATSSEDQKSTFFSEGQLKFEGTGSLTVISNAKHAICSDDYINIESGTITVSSAVKDGIHAKDYFAMSGGTLNITATSDAIESEGYIDISGGNITTINPATDAKAIASDSIMVISGGTIQITLNGNQSKGIKSDQNMTLSGGTIGINTSGGVVLESSGSGYDPSYCSAIKCDSSITISGANITIGCTGIAGKGISADKNINITSGVINITCSGNGATYKNTSGTTDSYNATCITSDNNTSILGGTVTISNSGSAGKGISTDGNLIIGDASNSPTLKITTSGSKIAVSSEYAEAKAVKSDGSITINNGNTTISSADDGLKSEVSTIINNGTVSITKSIEGMESPIITVNNGNVSIISSDDGFNATKGNGGETNDGSALNFNGGIVYVSSSAGDGLDSNGNMVITGGTIVVHGPPSQPEVGMDYNGTCNISGGFLVVSGISSTNTQAPSKTSSQYSVKVTSSTITSSTLFHIQDASGADVVTFKPERNYSAIIFSSTNLISGAAYYIYTGGNYTGTVTNGLYTGGTYSGGTQRTSFKISSTISSVTF